MGAGASSPRKTTRELSIRQLKNETRESDVNRFINFEDLKVRTSFPRYPENFEIAIDVATIDLSKSLMVYISHQWLRCSPVEDAVDDDSHPDSEFHEQFLLCVAGIQRLHDACASKLKKCYIWLDYGCINQNGNPASRLKSLATLMEYCDCMFTPIVDNSSWVLEHTPNGLYKDYLAEGFAEYLGRAWCRLELWYMSSIPMSNYSLNKLKRTSSSLRNALFAKRRPHYVFGSKEYREDENPLCFPPLLNSFFEEFLPCNGLVSRHRDLKKIEQLVKDLKPFIKNKKVGYEGKKNPQGQLHGQGSFTFSSGNIYEGMYKNNKRDGFGRFYFANGNVYSGEWKEDRRHGHGSFSFLSGDLYVGDWEMNKKHGKGRFEYANGNCYEGMYKNDKKHGPGKFTYADGQATYEGMFCEDKMDGYGVFRFADGDVYEGQWKNDMKHGHGKYSSKSNETYVGEWRNNLQHGQGVYTFFNGDRYDGEWLDGKRNGFGKFYFQDGTMLKRMWEDGKMLEEES